MIDTPQQNYRFESTKQIKPHQIELFEGLKKKEPQPVSSLDGGFLMIATPRCGSTYLGELLNSTGRIGTIEEWFNYEYFMAWMMVNGIEEFNLKDYLTWIAQRTAVNGVFSLKWHVGQIAEMFKQFNVGIESIKWKRVIYLNRRKKIEQAVSLAKAIRTNQFRSYETPEQDDHIDLHDISFALERICQQEKYFYQLLESHTDLTYHYEELVADPVGQCNTILRALGQEPASSYETRVQKQADEGSIGYARAFMLNLLGELHNEVS